MRAVTIWGLMTSQLPCFVGELSKKKQTLTTTAVSPFSLPPPSTARAPSLLRESIRLLPTACNMMSQQCYFAQAFFVKKPNVYY